MVCYLLCVFCYYSYTCPEYFLVFTNYRYFPICANIWSNFCQSVKNTYTMKMDETCDCREKVHCIQVKYITTCMHCVFPVRTFPHGILLLQIPDGSLHSVQYSAPSPLSMQAAQRILAHEGSTEYSMGSLLLPYFTYPTLASDSPSSQCQYGVHFPQVWSLSVLNIFTHIHHSPFFHCLLEKLCKFFLGWNGVGLVFFGLGRDELVFA